MSRESMGWRSSQERYGRWWGQQQRPSTEMGEWELGLGSNLNGGSVKLEYLRIVDEVSGLAKMKQVKILGQITRVEGELKEFLGGLLQNMLLTEKLRKKPETMGEITSFLGEVVVEQIKEENEWFKRTGRGRWRKEEDVEEVLDEVIEEMWRGGKMSEEEAKKVREWESCEQKNERQVAAQ